MVKKSNDRPSPSYFLALIAVSASLVLAPAAQADEGRLRVELLLKGLECLRTTNGLGDDCIWVTHATVNLANGRSFVGSDHVFNSVGADEFHPTFENSQGIGGFWPVKNIDDIVIFFLVAESDLGSGGQLDRTAVEIDRQLKKMLPELKHKYTWQNLPRDQAAAQIRGVIDKAWTTREKKQDDLVAITELRLMSEDISTTQIKKERKRHPAVGDGGAFALHVQVTSGPFEHGNPAGNAGAGWQGSPGQPGSDGGQQGPGAGGTAQGAGQPTAQRSHWAHPAGSFRMVGGKKWNEYDANGAVKFNYVETQRNAQFVELYDASRKGFFRLYTDHATGKHPTLSNNQWIDVFKGSWATPPSGTPPGDAQKARTHWAYAGGHIQHVGGKNWQEHQGGKLHATFTEQERTAEHIQLYNAQGSIWVRLTDKAMQVFNGHDRDKGWQQYRSGKWTK